ncbi:alcohol dehydrogenase catalytic domain-containing protein [Kribbella sp. WER1]
MRVARVREFGGPEVLEAVEAPRPEAVAGQVVIGVEAAEVLFLDTQLRAGWGQEHFTLEPPFVPGAGVAGVVRSVGAGVDAAWIGERVIAGTGGVGTYKVAGTPSRSPYR